MSDPANDRARSRSILGLTRELEQERTDLPPDPSRGGTRGYPVWFRRRVLAFAALHGHEAAATNHGCSIRSIYNWENRIEPHRMTGGYQREALTGMDMLLLLAVGM